MDEQILIDHDKTAFLAQISLVTKLLSSTISKAPRLTFIFLYSSTFEEMSQFKGRMKRLKKPRKKDQRQKLWQQSILEALYTQKKLGENSLTY